MKRLYLIRLDDACPTQDHKKWDRMESLLDKYDIKPIVGIIPNCRDNMLKRFPTDDKFWEKALIWQNKGWTIALHGYDHCYISHDSGINPFWNRSEFAGIPYETQSQKVLDGVKILKDHLLIPKLFFAPSHTFDNNTLEALRNYSDIRIISDSIGRFPYRCRDFLFVPQIFGRCVKMPFNGIFTFCFHPNTMSDASFVALENFLRDNKCKFICFDEIDINKYGQKRTFDVFLSWLFFTYRRIRGLK